MQQQNSNMQVVYAGQQALQQQMWQPVGSAANMPKWRGERMRVRGMRTTSSPQARMPMPSPFTPLEMHSSRPEVGFSTSPVPPMMTPSASPAAPPAWYPTNGSLTTPAWHVVISPPDISKPHLIHTPRGAFCQHKSQKKSQLKLCCLHQTSPHARCSRELTQNILPHWQARQERSGHAHLIKTCQTHVCQGTSHRQTDRQTGRPGRR